MDSKTRRFNLGDLTILIAASALAMATLRSLWLGMTSTEGNYLWQATPFRLVVAAALSACATPLSLACLAFRLRHPRPSWRRLALRPGIAAMIACGIIVAWQTAELAGALARPKVEFFTGTQVSSIRFDESASLVVMRPKPNLTNGLVGHLQPLACFGIMVVSLTTPCGPAVAAVWTVLALAGRWRPEASWIDRLGRGLGTTWIVVSVLAAFPIGP